MKEVLILGRNYKIERRNWKERYAELSEDALLVGGEWDDNSLKEFLRGFLFLQLVRIYEELRKKSGIEIYGDLHFEVVDKIDRNQKRVAKLKGNKIFVKLNVVMLPRGVIEYIVAHELAHIFCKRHTRRFWQIVEKMCPNYIESQIFLEQNVHLIVKKL